MEPDRLCLPLDSSGPGTAFVVFVGGLWARRVPRGDRSRGPAGRETAVLIKTTPHLELIREPDLGVVLFRRLGWKPSDYDTWAQALHDEQIAFIPPTKWEGETVGRFAFLHPHTTMDLVKEILDRTA